MKEPAFRAFRMERSAMDTAAERRADDHRHRSTPPVVILGRHLGDLVEGARNEIRKLHLDDRAQPIIAAPIAAPTNPDSASGRIENSPFAVFV